MPENIYAIVAVLLCVVLGSLQFVSIIVKRIKNRHSPVKAVQAVVIGKNKVDTFDKYAGNGKHEKYVVIFSIDGKKKSFYVSPFSYSGYRINEKGTLKYQGDKIIEFK